MVPNIEKEKVTKLLAEVARLTIKEKSLESSIKSSQKILDEINSQIVGFRSERDRLDPSIKQLRKESEDLKRIVDGLNSDISKGQDCLREQGDKHRDQLREIARHKNELETARKASEKASDNLKALRIELEDKDRAVKARIENLNISLGAIKDEHSNNIKAMVVAASERRAFETLKEDIETLKADLIAKNNKKADEIKAVSDELALAKNKNAELENILSDSKRARASLKEEIESLQSERIEYEAKMKSHGRERLAFEEEKKVHQIDVLRFKKLVKQKSVARQLAALKRG